MSEFYFENQGNSTYFVYQAADDDELDTLTLGMLTNNNIANFAPVVFTRQDAFMYVKYNVTAKVSVQQLWGDVVSKKHLIGVLKGIIGAVLNAEEYMIDVNSLVFDVDKIFVDVSTGNIEMICLPIIEEQKESPDLKMLFREILFSARLNPNENNDYFVRLMNFLNDKSAFSIQECREILESESYLITKNGTNQEQEQNAVKTAKNNRGEQNVVSQANGSEMSQPPKVSVDITNQAKTEEKSPMPQSYASSADNRYGGIGTNGMVVPPMQQVVPPQQPVKHPANVPGKAQEKEMSWFYLMQHYNSENAALYKEQKAKKKKLGKEPVKEKDNGKTKESKKDKKSTAVPQQSVQFAIPGQVATPSYDAPAAKPTQNAESQPTTQQSPVSNMYSQPIPGNFVKGKANFGETTVLSSGGMGETTVLSNAGMMQDVAKMKPYLLRVKNNEKILLDKPVFRIGKERSYVDYFIGDNTAISRSHANIISRGDEYFIVDTNSTNHTYVNNVMIQSNEEIRLMEGTKIKLANEDFEFHLK